MLDMVLGDCFYAISNIEKANVYCWKGSTKMKHTHFCPTRSLNFSWTEGIITSPKADIVFWSLYSPVPLALYPHCLPVQLMVKRKACDPSLPSLVFIQPMMCFTYLRGCVKGSHNSTCSKFIHSIMTFFCNISPLLGILISLTDTMINPLM